MPLAAVAQCQTVMTCDQSIVQSDRFIPDCFNITGELVEYDDAVALNCQNLLEGVL